LYFDQVLLEGTLMKRFRLMSPLSVLVATTTITLLGMSVNVAAQQVNQNGEFTTSDHAETPPLRSIMPLPEKEGHRAKPIRLVVAAAAGASRVDPALQTRPAAAVTIGNVVSFDGLGVGGGYTPNAAPPDTNGAVGATQFVQWVNESFAVYDKTTAARLYGPAAGNTLFQALGASHPCAVNNDGDPIAQYDKAAGRWVMTQFSVTNGSSQGYWQCVAVSKTSDATGAYNVYAFNYGTVQFNDYPKLGVWNNAYLVTYNIFNNGSTFAGSKLCAFDRAAMLAGTAANQVCFQTSNLYGGHLPSDIDGPTAPPAGSPGYFIAFDVNDLLMWRISNLNFTTSTATLTGPITIPTAAFSAACNGGGTCIPQSGTSQLLDSLADRLMYRLAYRNFGDHEALVVNHSVTAGSSVGIRWYELRSPNAPSPVVYQQGTFAPDTNYRWMGSAAMDKAGNMAVGYSVSSTALHPGINFTGRAPTDPLGTLGTPEIHIKDGLGSQNGGLNRWGDYSSMSIDPVDDCTMWYTTEYLQTNGSFQWSTRIGYFKFANCGAVTTPDFALATTPASQTVTAGAGTSYTTTVTPSGGFNGTVNFSVSGLPAGAAGTFNPASVTTSGSTTLSVTTSSTTPAGSYPLTITGTSGSIVHTNSVTLVVNAAPVPDYSVSATPASQTVIQGSGTSYTATVTPVNGFTGTVTFSVAGLPAGAAGTFNPTSVNTSGSSTLSVTTSASTPTGSYPLTITGTSGTLSHSASVTLVVNAAPVPDYSVSATPASQTVIQGAGTSYTATVTPVNGFTGTVTFSVTGLPSGASGTFNPTSVTTSGSSTLSVTTTATTPTGSYPLTITGTSGTLSHSASVTLVVNPAPTPNFSLSATPASQTVTQGAGTSYTATVTPSNGFTGTVSFSVAGLPAGAGATFNPTTVTTSGNTTMSVTTSTTTPAGSYPLTITGTSGSLSHTASVTLVVNAISTADFTVTATPASRTISQGASTTYTATVTPSGGFTGSVALSVTGLPAGATGTFSPASITTSGTSTLTVRTTATTTAGTFPLTIRGVNGTKSHTASVTLVVNAACTDGNCQN
jgi:uncharacterized membrane protein